MTLVGDVIKSALARPSLALARWLRFYIKTVVLK